MKNEKKEIVIAGVHFKNNTEAENFARKILHAGEANTKLNVGEFQFMQDYFAFFHHEWKDKLNGSSADYFLRIIEPKYKKKSFKLFRKQESDFHKGTDISFLMSNMLKRNYLRDFKSAMRNVIEPQIMEYKTDFFSRSLNPECPIANIKMTISNSHVDHFNPTFDELLMNFMKENKIEKEDLKKIVAESKDNQINAEIRKEYSHIRVAFYEYHKYNCSLRVISSIENLKR